MGVVATIPEQFLDRNLRMSDFAFLDGFEGYASELPIALLDSRACRPKGRQGCQTDGESVLLDPIAPALCRRPREARDLHRRFDESLKGTANQEQA